MKLWQPLRIRFPLLPVSANKPRLLVYVAGPFSGKGSTKEEKRANTERNIARAVQLGIKVAKLGACPVVPHANTAHPDYEDVQPYAFWIEATAEQLRRCDAVIFTEDWEESSGARGENELAIAEMIPRFFHLSDLAAFLNQDDLAALGVNWAHPHGPLPTDRADVDPDWLPTPVPSKTESEVDWQIAREARARRVSPAFSSRLDTGRTSSAQPNIAGRLRPNTGN
jgi:hypothetical protein